MVQSLSGIINSSGAASLSVVVIWLNKGHNANNVTSSDSTKVLSSYILYLIWYNPNEVMKNGELALFQ